MAANNDPQPSTSNGAPQQNGGGELIRSATSTMAPLTEAELAYIKKILDRVLAWPLTTLAGKTSSILY